MQGLHALSDFLDDACDVETGYVGGAGRRRIKSAPLLDIRPIYARRNRPYQYLPGTGTRPLPINDLKNLRTARLFDLDNYHQLTSAPVSLDQAYQTGRIVSHHCAHFCFGKAERKAELDRLPHAFNR